MYNTKREDHLMQVTNKKTGDIYYVDDVVIDSTNDLEPEEQVKVLYSNDKAERFVREAHEFIEKFYIPHGFNILSKACELAMKDVEEFHNKCCVEPGKATWNPTTAKINTYVRVDDFYNEDGSTSHPRPEGVLDKTEMDELIRKETSHSCNNEKEYIGEMIDIDIYNTYKQTIENRWYVPLAIVKSLARKQLSELFTRRCSDFDIVKKEYDNATNDYFLIGYRTYNDFPKNPCQVCKLPKEVFDKIYDAIDAEEDDDRFFDD